MQDLDQTFPVVAPSGIFVRAIPTLDTQVQIHNKFMEAPGERLDDLHCTLMYSLSSVTVQVPFSFMDKDKRYLAYATQVSYWPGNNGDGYLVLELNSADLLLAHTNWKTYGFEPTYKTYRPHVAISHPVDEEQARRYSLDVNRRPFFFLKALRFYMGGIAPLSESQD